VKSILCELLCLSAAGYLQIVFTSNMGPHRKLLPALRRFWIRDVFIATVDDDMSRAQSYIILYQLLKTFVVNNCIDAVVALRARRISFCAAPPYRVTKYYSWPVVHSYNRQEMLVLPTGTGGVLYQPKFFPEFVFIKPFWYATGTADDMMFRLATMHKKIPVVLGCSMLYQQGRVTRSCRRDDVDRAFDVMHGYNSTHYYQRLLDQVPKRLVLRDLKFNNTMQSDTVSTLALSSKVSRTAVAESTNLIRDNRRLYTLKSALKRNQRNGNETELFAINRSGGNDLAWKLANDVLKSLFKFNFDSIVRDNMFERDDVCYEEERSKSVKIERYCGIFDCDKPKLNSSHVLW
jgi:hypothetical protein